MDFRQKEMVFPYAKLYESGGQQVEDEIDKIREAILNKDGIVEAEMKEQFNFFVGNCMSR
jgi:hypothetical protein